MHWWRHYFTREIEIEPEKNRITIWFGFPPAQREKYAKLVPPLQMPWIERELSRHREVLAENGLSWHIGSQVQEEAFGTLNEMPPDVESYMLQELARRKQVAAQQSRVDLLKHFDQTRSQLLAQIHTVQSRANTAGTAEFLTQMLRLSVDLWQLGSRLTARERLRSTIFFATKNGRSVPVELHIEAVIELAHMLVRDDQARDAMMTLVETQPMVRKLDDIAATKAKFYRLLASVALGAGYYKEGSEAAQEAIRLLPPGSAREEVAAELAEAVLLEGQQHPNDQDNGTRT
jgi:hypothetical protein